MACVVSSSQLDGSPRSDPVRRKDPSTRVEECARGGGSGGGSGGGIYGGGGGLN